MVAQGKYGRHRLRGFGKTGLVAFLSVCLFFLHVASPSPLLCAVSHPCEAGFELAPCTTACVHDTTGSCPCDHGLAKDPCGHCLAHPDHSPFAAQAETRRPFANPMLVAVVISAAPAACIPANNIPSNNPGIPVNPPFATHEWRTIKFSL
jgi:hypothetical protein